MRFPAAILMLFVLLASSSARAEPAGWGPPSNGLSLQATLAESKVPMGGALELTLRFRYEPTEARSTRFLTLETGSWSARILLTNRDTGATFERDWYSVGSLGYVAVPDPEDHMDLADAEERHIPIERRLLSHEGEQVPPGAYDAVVVFTADGGSGTRAEYVPGEKGCRYLPYPPGTLWRGTALSARERVDVLAAHPDTVEFEMPTWVSVRVEPSQMTWTFDSDKRRTIRVVRRPGFVAVPYMRFSYQIGSEESPSQDAGSSETDFYLPTQAGFYNKKGGSGTMQEWWDRGPRTIGGSELRSIVNASDPLRVNVAIVIYESLPGSRPGGYDESVVLWSDSLSTTWP